ncbi:indole-3-glycerol phosphate synthase TrpC [candidate division KSB1 bacterium]|nr:indole-3-glycerol phosphate synthase TrpC [candidate division KSB1 bacterium]
MILDRIVEKVQHRLDEQKRALPLSELKKLPVPERDPFSFKKAMQTPEISIIAEIKKASPSAGIIAPDFDPLRIANEYVTARVSAISVLTEPDFFQGSLCFLRDVRNKVKTPLLRKDFMIDPYQFYHARQAGADCVLLIAAILDPAMITDFIQLARELNMDALVEIHNSAELEVVLKLNPEIIGINNRDLKTFKVDLNTSFELKRLIPSCIVTVSESGIKSRTDVEGLVAAGFDAMLIGETFMRANDKPGMVKELLGN